MPAKRFWLMKSEPGDYSIDDLARDDRTCWDGVRNYQARNFMRDEMKLGDGVLFYHSGAEPSAVAGVARVCRAAHPDRTAQDRKNEHYDPKATPDNPIWMMVHIEFVEKFERIVPLAELKQTPGLDGILVAKRGQRLSVQPVEPKHFEIVLKLGNTARAKATRLFRRKSK